MTGRPQQPLLHRCACTSGISVSMLAVSALVHVTAHATALHTLRLFCDMQVGFRMRPVGWIYSPAGSTARPLRVFNSLSSTMQAKDAPDCTGKLLNFTPRGAVLAARQAPQDCALAAWPQRRYRCRLKLKYRWKMPLSKTQRKPCERASGGQRCGETALPRSAQWDCSREGVRFGVRHQVAWLINLQFAEKTSWCCRLLAAGHHMLMSICQNKLKKMGVYQLPDQPSRSVHIKLTPPA